MADGFQDGDILLYPYRWRREADQNRSIDGAKDRPVCLVIRSTDAQGRPVILLAPISSKPPKPGQSALEIPEIERRRGGLEKYPRAWITVDEATPISISDSRSIWSPKSHLGDLADRSCASWPKRCVKTSAAGA